jgi:tetratricopeptide (TPR) repeat protein
MKRWMWLSLAAVVVAAVAVTLVALPKAPDWTSTSPEAVAAFQAGMDAQMKVYYEDSRRNFQRAVELDPDFVIANLMAIDMYRDDEEKVAAMWSKVENADLTKLTPRERFYVQRARARHAKQPEEAQRLLDEYVAKYPNDPYILNQKAMETWLRGDLEDAERLYQRLVEIAPNWVIAYNQLGYINMMKGRFAEAEEYFKSYRFIAPDQANPHDSLGELFITQGRDDEARESLETAIRIKPDFWAAYQHLVLMQSSSGDFEGSRETIDRVKAAGASEDLVTSMECLVHYTELRNEGDWQEIMAEADSKCVQGFKEGYSTVATHFAACKLGEWEKAMEIEVETANLLEKMGDHGNEKDLMTLRGAFLHMQGVRLALQGNYAEAEEKLRAADEGLTYVEAGVGMYKLFNRMVLAEVLLADNQDAEAHGLLANVRSVNPVMVAEFEDSGLKNLGLDRM